MKHILIALVLLAFPADQPAEVWPVEIAAEYQGHDPQPPGLGMHVEIEIRNTEGTTLAHLLTVRPSPYYLEVSEPPPYEWRLKGLFHLASGGISETGVIDADGPNDEDRQRAGDIADYTYDPDRCPYQIAPCIVTGDNVVEARDFGKIAGLFGTTSPCCGAAYFEYQLADLDSDGVIGIGDYSLLRGSFGMSGYEFAP
jgi:hypothetical protein